MREILFFALNDTIWAHCAPPGINGHFEQKIFSSCADSDSKAGHVRPCPQKDDRVSHKRPWLQKDDRGQPWATMSSEGWPGQPRATMSPEGWPGSATSYHVFRRMTGVSHERPCLQKDDRGQPRATRSPTPDDHMTGDDRVHQCNCDKHSSRLIIICKKDNVSTYFYYAEWHFFASLILPTKNHILVNIIMNKQFSQFLWTSGSPEGLYLTCLKFQWKNEFLSDFYKFQKLHLVLY